jgi:hypothetical protein
VAVHLEVQRPTHPLQDDCDGLLLQDQCFGWGAGERSAPPVYDDDGDDDGGLNVSGSGCGSDSDDGAPPAALPLLN